MTVFKYSLYHTFLTSSQSFLSDDNSVSFFFFLNWGNRNSQFPCAPDTCQLTRLHLCQFRFCITMNKTANVNYKVQFLHLCPAFHPLFCKDIAFNSSPFFFIAFFVGGGWVWISTIAFLQASKHAVNFSIFKISSFEFTFPSLQSHFCPPPAKFLEGVV